jgi:hypothetical protein
MTICLAGRGDLLEVVGRAGGDLAEDDLLAARPPSVIAMLSVSSALW